MSVTDVFTLDEPFTAAPGLVAYVILKGAYPVQRLDDIGQALNAAIPLVQATFTGNLSNVGSATICALDALGGAMRGIRVKVFISGDTALLGITTGWYATRYSALATFTQQTVPSLGAQHDTGAAVVEDYEVGDLPEGLQGELRIASHGTDSALTFEAIVTYEQ